MRNALLICLLFTLLFSAVSIIRHKNYYSQGYDLGIFTQSAWLYSNFLIPQNTISESLDYQDRYKPIMMVLGLFYRVYPQPDFLLVLQAVSLAFSGLFIYLTSLKLGLKKILALVLMGHYLLFPGITAFINDDFHEVALFPFFFLGGYYFYLINKQKLQNLFLFFSLIIRDYLVIFSVIFWICVYIFNPKIRRQTRNALAINIFMTILMILIITITGGINYTSFYQEGDSLGAALLNLVSTPKSVWLFFTPLIKLKTVLLSLGYFLFLPLFNIWLIIPLIFQFAGRFLDLQHPYRWTINYHYSGELAAILTLGYLQQLSKIKKKFIKPVVILTIIISSIIIIYAHSPLFLLRKSSFWKQENWMSNNNQNIKLIPKNASVAAQNNLTPHLANRKEIYILPIIHNAEYIFMDLHPGQDTFNFYNQNYEMMRALQDSITINYRLISRIGDSYLYQKNR